MTRGAPELGLSIREQIGQARPAPQTLFHYTDINGLYGIVESESLLFSNAAFIADTAGGRARSPSASSPAGCRPGCPAWPGRSAWSTKTS